MNCNVSDCPLTNNILFQLFIVYGMNGQKAPAQQHVALAQELTRGLSLFLNLMEEHVQDILRKMLCVKINHAQVCIYI